MLPWPRLECKRRPGEARPGRDRADVAVPTGFRSSHCQLRQAGTRDVHTHRGRRRWGVAMPSGTGAKAVGDGAVTAAPQPPRCAAGSRSGRITGVARPAAGGVAFPDPVANHLYGRNGPVLERAADGLSKTGREFAVTAMAAATLAGLGPAWVRPGSGLGPTVLATACLWVEPNADLATVAANAGMKRSRGANVVLWPDADRLGTSVPEQIEGIPVAAAPTGLPRSAAATRPRGRRNLPAGASWLLTRRWTSPMATSTTSSASWAKPRTSCGSSASPPTG